MDYDVKYVHVSSIYIYIIVLKSSGPAVDLRGYGDSSQNNQKIFTSGCVG